MLRNLRPSQACNHLISVLETRARLPHPCTRWQGAASAGSPVMSLGMNSRRRCLRWPTRLSDRLFCCSADRLLLCRFSAAGMTVSPRTPMAGGRKAPRHEIAGSWAPARQRALCGFNVAAALDGKRDASAKRRHVCIPENRRECSGASRRAREVQQRTGC
jgi:hypothetical protein